MALQLKRYIARINSQPFYFFIEANPLKLNFFSHRTYRNKHSNAYQWPILALAIAGTALTVSSAHANDPETIDRLTQQWLDTDRQASHLQSDWQTQKPVLEQRLALLAAEKDQLQAILQTSNDGQNDVEARREELLATQSELEQQQQSLTQTLKLLTSRVEALGRLLPPPLNSAWQEEQTAQTDQSETSQQLQLALAQLSLLADFDQRVTVHEMPITAPDGDKVLVKQLYLGVGMAWFTSADGAYAGWGKASASNDASWTWHSDDSIDASEIIKAIAIFEKRQQADFVYLPVKLDDADQAGDKL
jgi:hypothetical protein